MVHLLNILCANVLIYAFVTRGALGVARGLSYATRMTGWKRPTAELAKGRRRRGRRSRS
jgi:hypothetical protein